MPTVIATNSTKIDTRDGIAPYSLDFYNSLPSVRDAYKHFICVGGVGLVESFEELFIAHQMERTFGLVMIHRHFPLEPGEKLVSYKGTASPLVGANMRGWKSLRRPSGALTTAK